MIREETLCVFELYSSPSNRLFKDWGGLGIGDGRECAIVFIEEEAIGNNGVES